MIWLILAAACGIRSPEPGPAVTVSRPASSPAPVAAPTPSGLTLPVEMSFGRIALGAPMEQWQETADWPILPDHLDPRCMSLARICRVGNGPPGSEVDWIEARYPHGGLSELFETMHLADARSRFEHLKAAFTERHGAPARILSGPEHDHHAALLALYGVERDRAPVFTIDWNHEDWACAWWLEDQRGLELCVSGESEYGPWLALQYVDQSVAPAGERRAWFLEDDERAEDAPAAPGK